MPAIAPRIRRVYESFRFNRSLPRRPDAKQQPNAACLYARRRLLQPAGGLLAARQISRPALPVRRSLIGSCVPIQNDWNARSKLAQEVEVRLAQRAGVARAKQIAMLGRRHTPAVTRTPDRSTRARWSRERRSGSDHRLTIETTGTNGDKGGQSRAIFIVFVDLFGRYLRSGRRGRRFESCHSDHSSKSRRIPRGLADRPPAPRERLFATIFEAGPRPIWPKQGRLCAWHGSRGSRRFPSTPIAVDEVAQVGASDRPAALALRLLSHDQRQPLAEGLFQVEAKQ